MSQLSYRPPHVSLVDVFWWSMNKTEINTPPYNLPLHLPLHIDRREPLEYSGTPKRPQCRERARYSVGVDQVNVRIFICRQLTISSAMKRIRRSTCVSPALNKTSNYGAYHRLEGHVMQCVHLHFIKMNISRNVVMRPYWSVGRYRKLCYRKKNRAIPL